MDPISDQERHFLGIGGKLWPAKEVSQCSDNSIEIRMRRIPGSDKRSLHASFPASDRLVILHGVARPLIEAATHRQQGQLLQTNGFVLDETKGYGAASLLYKR